MPKRYEEEINEILHKFDDWPPSDRGSRPREAPRRTAPRVNPMDHIGPQQVMVLGLALILAGVLLHFSAPHLSDRAGLVAGFSLGTYATAVGFLVLLFGYILAVIRGGSSGGVRLGRNQQFWRGQVVDLRPSNRGLSYWFWRLRSNLRNGRR
ncbi:MAG TPA: hypothetical protein VK009_18135 [Chloroflexota bacterium]|nr:hypothetical protein [Chloroflexota bacterium]